MGAVVEYRGAIESLFVRTSGAALLGLERTTALLDRLGNPHRAIPALHIAGTNGKGSVAAMAEALLRHAGFHVGKYTSPHLVDFRERIIIDGRPVDEEVVAAFVRRWMPEIERIGATFFEATTAMAFHSFVASHVDVMVVEVGLGGRLDSTNVITPLAAAVTSIGLDHTGILGTTLEDIAAEKAGIFKRGVPAVIGEPDPGVRQRLVELAHRAGATPVHAVFDRTRLEDVRVTAQGTTFTAVDDRGRRDLRVPLAGAYQAANALVALELTAAAGEPFVPASFADAAAALAGVQLPGRFQVVPPYVFDVAHNPAGAAALADTLRLAALPRPIHALLGVLADKDWKGIIRALAGVVDEFVMTTPPTAPSDRVWDGPAAVEFARAEGIPARWTVDFDQALEEAAREAATVVVTGSFHTVGAAMSRLQVSPLRA